MSIKDKQKWDAKYIKKSQLLLPRDASINLVNHLDKCVGKRALDLACGAGRNTIYLAKHGFKVDALDIAQIALDALHVELKSQNLSHLVNTKLIDLDKFSEPKNSYDLVLMCNFLDRELIQKAQFSLAKDGVFIVETYMVDEKNEKENSDRNNLLEKNELKDIFTDDYEILFYDEYDNEPHEIYQMKKQVIIAKKKV